MDDIKDVSVDPMEKRKTRSGSVALVSTPTGDRHSRRASVIHVLPQEAVQEAPPSLMETSYPRLFHFLTRKHDWEAPFQLIEIALEIFNDKRFFARFPDKEALEDLKFRYRNWWMIVKNNPQIQDANLRKLGKLIKDFLITALEDASPAMKLSLFAPDRPIHTPVIRDSKLDHKEISPLSQSKTSELKSTTSVATDDQKAKPVHDASKPIEFVEPIPGAVPSKLTLQSRPSKFQPIPPGDISTDVLKPPTKLDDEMYMQLIVKDILNDISAREIAEQKSKLVTISDKMGWEDDTHHHRSSGTVGTHGRLSIFGGRRISVASKPGVVGGSRVPLASAKPSRIGLTSNESNVTGMRHPGVGSKIAADTMQMHGALVGKIEGLKIKMDKASLKDPSIQSHEKGKSIKDKVHLKLRLHTQVQSYVRPLGKK